MTDLPARVDVAIIGGGFAGCATGWLLHHRYGIRNMIVLEREAELGRYASGRGAGLGRQLCEDIETTALATCGAMWLRDDEHFSRAWTPCGGVLSFDDPAQLEAYAARARSIDLPHEVVGRTAIAARWPALADLASIGGIAVPSDGVIDVRALLDELSTDLTIARDCGVIAIEPGIVCTTRGAIEARVVVDASGAWAGALTGDPPLDAIKRHLFVIEATPEHAAPYLWHLGRDELYVRPGDGGVVMSPCDGTPMPPADAQPTPDGDAALRAKLAAAAPAWRDARVLRRWACQRAFTADRRMRLGRDPQRPWLVWAAGLGGHGATASLAVGTFVAQAVEEALG